jgi:hypothetical protein
MTEPDSPFAQLRNNGLKLVDDCAEAKLSGSSRLRMLITALVAANWVTLQIMLFYLTDLITGLLAVKIAIYTSIVLFGLNFVVSRLPSIARTIQIIGGQR